jgi:glycosyltransferase involved in cell wall biosynthesis
MKLIIQVPCYNEEKTLAIALAELPRQVAGFDKVEWQWVLWQESDSVSNLV